jgi:uncharacterized protein (TIGR02001 family)
MHKLISAVIGCTLCSGMAAGMATAAEYEVSGNVTMTTDYRFRGIAQGARSPAIQGGFDLETESGLYLGAWASNVNFTEAAIELNYYAGYAFEIAEGMELDVGALYYNYPHGPSGDLDYIELYTSVTFGGLTLAVDYSPDYFGGTGTFFYVHGGYEVALLQDVSLGLHVGYNLLDDETFLAHHSKDSYLDWRISLVASRFGLTWDLAYVDTDLSRSQCFGGTKLCQGTVVFSVSKSL